MTKLEVLEYSESLEDAIDSALAALREDNVDRAIEILEEFQEESGGEEE